MKIPYAVRDFDKLIAEEYIYMDRTDRIPLIENMGYELLFLRPRRFGKSLLVSMLMNYYDVAKAADYEQLFGKLAIAKNPTPLRNRYFVMKWDFSNVQAHGTLKEIEQSLHQHVNQRVRKFVDDYAPIFPQLPEQVTIHPENSLVSFHSAVAAVGRTPYKLYLFIDEYDNFANEVMMGGTGAGKGDQHQRYLDMVKGEGMFKSFFKNIKSAASGDGLDRVFMTGVSPVVMNDEITQIMWQPDLNDLCGFREEEVIGLLEQVAQEQRLSLRQQGEVLALMRMCYAGSCFTMEDMGMESQANRTYLYNPTSVFYFLNHLYLYGCYPPNMLDENWATDSDKLADIFSCPTGQELLFDILNEEKTLSISEIEGRFGARELLQPDKPRAWLASFLSFWGALSPDGQTPTGQRILKTPNLAMGEFLKRLVGYKGVKSFSREGSLWNINHLTQSNV